MIHFIYLLFSATILFSLTSYLFYLFNDKTKLSFNFVEEEKLHTYKSINTNDIFFSKDIKSLNFKKEKKEFTDSEIFLKLKKLNRQLTKNLNTLIYLFKIEANSKNKNNKDYLIEFFDFKRNIEQETLKITKKIKHYKSLQIQNLSELH